MRPWDQHPPCMKYWILFTVTMQTDSYPHFIGKETTAQSHTARSWQSKESAWLPWHSKAHALPTTTELRSGALLSFWRQNSLGPELQGKTAASKWQEKIELVRHDPEQRSNSESFSFISATWDHSPVSPWPKPDGRVRTCHMHRHTPWDLPFRTSI